MNPEEQELLNYIEQHAWDDTSGRLVYADWLEEHDRLEEAERQRKMVPAIRWLKEFAEEAGASYEEVVDAARKYAADGTISQVGDFMGLDACNAMYDNENGFWENISIVTGTQNLPKDDCPFSCCY